MKRIIILIGVLLSTGCALQQQKPAPSISAEQAQVIGASIASYAESLYPPAHTDLHVSLPADSDLAQVISDALKHTGFGVSDAELNDGVPFTAAVELVDQRAFVRVVTPRREASCLIEATTPCSWTVRNTP